MALPVRLFCRKSLPLSLMTLEDRTVPAVTFPDYTVGRYPFGWLGGEDVTRMDQPASYFVANPDGYLTGPQPGDRNALALQNLREFAGWFDVPRADTEARFVAITDSYADSGMQHVYLRQTVNGLPVINSSVGVHYTADGRLSTINGGFFPGLSALDAGQVPAPLLSPQIAVVDAAFQVGVEVNVVPAVVTGATGADRFTVLSSPEASAEPINARLAYVFSAPAGTARQVWHFEMAVPGGQRHYHVGVDTQTGEVLFSNDWAKNFGSYQALALPNESPADRTESPLNRSDDDRTVEVNPFDPNWSPFGWHDTDGKAGAEFSDTRGNNVSAQLDVGGANPTIVTPTAGGNRPDGGPQRVYTNPYDFTQQPNLPSQQDALVTNLFYMNNMLHDIHAAYGFTEAAGNFQFLNYTGQGLGGDQVNADAQDGSGTNNAVFIPRPEGVAPRMQMYRFTVTNPGTDSDLENAIIAHEYGHGVSTRLTGGPADVNTLDTIQSAALGEGWSDFHGLMITQRATDRPDTPRPQGPWVLGQNPVTGNGVREFPYSFNLATAPGTFAQFNATTSVDIYFAGARWANTLWDMNWLLVAKHGFDADLTTGYAPGGGPASAGNKLTLKLVMEALKLQQANPTFIQARDAVLQADVNLTGGLNRREIWTAFARRGLGFGSSTAGSTSTTLVSTTTLPAAAANPGVIAVTPPGRSAVAPGTIDLTFSEAIDPASFSLADITAFTGPGGVSLLAAITGATFTSPTTLRVTFNPPTGLGAQGAYALTVGPNVADTAGNLLDQNFDGTTGGTADAFTAYFQYDPTQLAVAEFLPPTGALVSPQLAVIDVRFNEPVDPASVSKADLQISQGPAVVTGASVLADGSTVRFTVSGLATGVVYLQIKQGTVADRFGFTNTTDRSTFSVSAVNTVLPLPVPFAALGPVGSLAYQTPTPTAGALGSAQDLYQFTVALEAGQSFNAIVEPTGALAPRAAVIGPDGVTLASAVAPAGGKAAGVYGVPVAVAGTYAIQVSAGLGTIGGFTVRAQLNAAQELEAVGGATNDTRPTAQPLAGFLAVAGGGSVVTVTGTADPAASDFYSLTLAAGTVLTAGLQQATGTAAFEVLNQAGTVVAASAPAGGGTSYNAAAGYTATVDGKYYLRVPGGAADPYTLTVATNAALDVEPNGTAATATPLGTAAVAVGGIPAAGDADVFTFTAVAGNLIRVTTATPGDRPGEFDNLLDPAVLVTAPDGTTTFADDNSAADGRNATVAFTAPADGAYAVRVSSAAGGAAAVGVYTVTVSNRVNILPTNVSAGGPYTLLEGGTLDLRGTATEVEGDPLTFTWDVNGDGVYGDATGPTPTLTTAQLDALGANDGPVARQVRVRVSDGGVPVISDPADLTVNNAPPTARFDDAVVVEGSAGAVGFADPADPSAADVAAGFRYAYDIDADGTWEFGDPLTGGAGPTLTLPADRFPDGGTGKTLRVRGRILDKDGGAFTVVSTVSVLNAAPTGFPVGGGAVAEGSAGQVSLTNVTDPAVTDAASLRYAFDFNADGTFDLGTGTYAGGVTSPTAAVPAQFLDDGPSPRAVRVRVTDKDGGFSQYQVLIPVTNVAPTATFFNPGPVTEGQAGTVTFAGPADPSAADTAAGFTYSYDFDNDGSFDVANSAKASVAVPASFLPDGGDGRSLTVRGRIADKDGGFTEYTTAIPVRNVAPTATFGFAGGAGGTVPEGGGVTVRFTAPTDPSAADTAAGFLYTFDFDNDGTFDLPPSPTADGVVPAAILDNGPGPRTVRGRILDRDGGATDYTATVTVTNVAPTAAPVFGPTALIGTASTLSLTGAADVSAGDTAAGFTYGFDFDGDGVYEVSGRSPTAAAVYDTPGVKPVGLRVTDRDGGSTSYAGFLTVTNAPPTATFAVTGPVSEGGLATVRFSDARQPSPATTAAGFRYAFDLDNDGTFELGDGTYARSVASPDVTLPPARTAEAGTFTVRGRIVEVNGLFTDYSTTVTVRNVAPTAVPLPPPATNPLAGEPVTVGVGQPSDPSAADRNSLTYSFDFSGDGIFEVAGSKEPTATFAYPAAGRFTAVVRVSDPKGGSTDYRIPVEVGSPPPVVAPATPTFYAVGSDVGGGSVRLFDDFGTEVYNARPFGDGFTGGVRVATADVNGDGTPDLIAGTGPGGVTRLVVIDGRTRATVMDVQPFEEQFTGGVFVAGGDTDGDGRAEVFVTPDQGGGPVVAVYDSAGGQTARFFGIEDPAFRGGARPAVADVDGDGKADLLVAAGFGGGPRLAGFSGPSLAAGRPVKLFADFFVFEDSLRNGVFVAAGDLNRDGAAELVVGGGPGGGPRVLALDGRGLTEGRQSVVANFFAGDAAGRDGVRVSVADLDLDGDADVLAAAATPGANGFRVRGFKASDLLAGQSPERYLLDPFPGELGGVFVG